jgi:hypothetical protein
MVNVQHNTERSIETSASDSEPLCLCVVLREYFKIKGPESSFQLIGFAKIITVYKESNIYIYYIYIYILDLYHTSNPEICINNLLYKACYWFKK